MVSITDMENSDHKREDNREAEEEIVLQQINVENIRAGLHGAAQESSVILEAL